VKFISYFKFSFTFGGKLDDGRNIMVAVGGNSDNIYRLEVGVNCEETIASLDPYTGSVYDKGVEVESFYDY